MLVLLDTPNDLSVCEAEIRQNAPEVEVGQLVTPAPGYRNRAVCEGRKFAIDNSAFSRFDAKRFMAIIEREKENRDKCLFVSVPDVVASARRTLEVFHYWYPKLNGWPLALVAQDGIEDLEIPWRLIAAVFIGGTDNFKLGHAAEAVVKAAQAMGKHVHVGRVNTPGRFDKFFKMGVDSIDGTGIARYTHMRLALGRDGNGGGPGLWDEHKHEDRKTEYARSL
jgi:hypothetical protein